MAGGDMFAEYIDWRAEHPSDDLMTQLLDAEFEDDKGTVRTLTREEMLTYVNLLAGAGNETTTRLIGWTGKLLGEHPDQRRLIAHDRTLVPSAIEEILRYEAPSPVQARYVAGDVEHYGHVSPKEACMLAPQRRRQPRRAALRGGRPLRRPARQSAVISASGTASTSASARRWPGSRARVALDEVLQRFPDWEVDHEHAVQACTSTVRGWETLPVFTT